MASFRFKQFEIRQDQCAMKVGTDGVLLGAWANAKNCTSILDIGTGTGLIALMLAQRNQFAFIDAIEIDSSASEQAGQNFLLSPWAQRLSVFNKDFEAFEASHTYDLIVTNPPYFQNSFKPLLSSRKLARHSDHFSIETWMNKIAHILSPEGLFSIILPASNYPNFKNHFSNRGFHLSRVCEVYPNPLKPCKRLLIELSRIPLQNVTRNKLVIELNERHQYSEDYKQLTNDFYLLF